ncbi:MAG: DUF6152 family protein [Gammaproteobacteria bacterium]|nr:DUF6152 family protein [Gammaproteobacteria bacterium]
MKRFLAKSVFSALTLTMVLNSVNVLAHHSFAAEFDADSIGHFQGVITEVRFTNPHVRYRIEVESDDGITESWELQARSITSLRAEGWLKDSVNVGDVVSVEGQLGRNGTKKLFIRGIQIQGGAGLGNMARSENENTGSQDDLVVANAQGGYGFGDIETNYPVDITGYWSNRYKFQTTVDDLQPKPVPLTPEGRALYESNDKYDDPVLRCLAYGLPRTFGNPYNMTVYDAGTHYMMLHVDQNSPRRVWMDGRSPDANTPATSNGYSVGRWEGRELYIDTTHLLGGWLDGSGYPMSGEGTRIEERFTIAADGLTMDRVMTIHDPYYTAPLTRVRGSARGTNLDVYQQGACDPTGYFSDLREAGTLGEYLNPEQYLAQ